MTPTPSQRGPDGRFVNPWPGARPPGIGSVFRWWRDRMRNRPPPDPDASVFSRATPAFAAPRAGPDQLTVTWIGHSALLLQIGGRNLLTDPQLGNRASPVGFAGPRRWVAPGVALDELPAIDLVLLSHNHYDHLDAGSVRSIARRWPEAPWVVPLELGAFLSALGVAQAIELDWWERRTVAGLEIAATPAQHFSGRKLVDRHRTLWCGFSIAAGGRRIFFAGDTAYHPEFGRIGEELGPFDAALIPVGAYEPRWIMRPVHMNPEEAVQAFVELAAGNARGIMVPIHWGTFKLTDEPMDEPPARTRGAWRAAGLPAERLWVPRHGETRTL
ncbi:MAG TPA: MBL fold metallo-hydrolase [Gemmatimonadales bacterium]|nr:MBL fold metallo-hydrolase [Gemmatimonadales bacterium]